MKYTFFFVFLYLITTFISCKPPAVAHGTEFSKYWCWVGDREGLDWEETIKDISDMGIGGILLNGNAESYKRVAPLAESYGIHLHAWRVIMLAGKETAEDHPDWLSVNKLGVSLADSTAYVPYYRFMCPILPEVREHIYEGIREILSIDGVKGISLDYTRYVDVILPEKLWAKYGIIQDKEYPQWDYGYHPAMIEAFMNLHGYNPQKNETTGGDTLWNQFRYDQINEIANKIANMVHIKEKVISASPFPTPSIARRLVRQDWDNWKLDLVFPMVYNGMYAEEGEKWMNHCIMENLDAMSGKSCRVYTGIYIPGHRSGDFDLHDAMETVLDSGSEGISFFDYHTMTADEKAVIKEFIAAHR